MRIISAIIHKHKQLKLTGNETIIYKPEKEIQLIGGMNGVGKSTLLKLLLDPSPDKRSFEENGFIEITIEHNDHTYVLSLRNKYSFIRDDEELNPHGLKKTQGQLFKEHFNLTAYMISVLSGYKPFYHMGPNERKDWLTLISNADFDYVINVYNKIKKRETEVKGGLSIAKNRLDSLQPTKDEDFKLENDIIALYKNLQKAIFANKKNIDLQYRDIEIKKHIDALNQSHKLLRSTKQSRDIEEIQFELKSVSNEIKNIKDKLDVNEDSFIEDIDNEIHNVKKEITVLTPYIKSVDKNDIPRIVYLGYDPLLTIRDIISNINSFKPDIRLFKKLNDRLELLDKKINEKTKLRLTLETEINLLKEASEYDDVECPKCHHSFKPDFDPDKLKNLEDKLMDLNNELTHLDKIFEEDRKGYNYIDSDIIMIDNLKTYIDDQPWLKRYKLDELESHLNDFVHVIKHGKRYLELKDKYNSLVKQKQVLEEHGVKVMMNKLNALQDKERALVQELNNAKIYLVRLNRFNQTYRELDDIIRLYGKQRKAVINQLHDKYADKILEHIDNIIINSEDRLSKLNMSKAIYKEKAKEVEELTNLNKTLKNLVEVLSPKKGLIGRSIMSELITICNDINEIVSDVFEYDIKIYPSDITDKGLDYKFKVIIDGNDPVDDINDLSSSQKEIIDLAFRVVSLRRLKMSKYPLILDEFGASFDPRHRANIYASIKDLSKGLGQLFIISHYAEPFIELSSYADTSFLTENFNKIIGIETTTNKIEMR